MSDVFGAMTELYSRGGTVTGDTWKIGEQSYTPATSGDALRYMDNPHLAGNGGYTQSNEIPTTIPSVTPERPTAAVSISTRASQPRVLSCSGGRNPPP